MTQIILSRCKILTSCLIVLFFMSCATTNDDQIQSDPSNIEDAKVLKEKLVTYHSKLDPPKSGEWLDQHDEKGQTFAQYVQVSPIKPTSTRKLLYIQKLGELDSAEQLIIDLTAEYLGIFYQMDVRILSSIPLDSTKIPFGSQRDHLGHHQYHSKYILYDILKPNLPDSAAAYIAFTAEDLYPDPKWNFVFGQASVKDRVGVWSIHRYGIPSAGETAFKEVLFRAMKVASHETGHMFTMRHCIDYECNMNGSNSLIESDRKPPYLCPECMAKMKWNLNLDEVKRFNEIDDFYADRQVNPYYKNYYNAVLETLDTTISTNKQ